LHAGILRGAGAGTKQKSDGQMDERIMNLEVIILEESFRKGAANAKLGSFKKKSS